MTGTDPYLLDNGGRRFPLTSPITTLGRSPEAQVFIVDRRASRRHAEIHCDTNGCSITDLDSTNGTTLNGLRLTVPQTLHPGDVISIGSATFTFHDPEATLRESHGPLLVVSPDRREIWVNQRPVTLTPKEQVLFELLYECQGRVISKQQIAVAVWPEYQAEVFDYQIESLVKRLREALEPDPRHPVLLLTIRGQGYRFVASH
ncbi:MAG: winged helix-turn-helix domain-containing protein [Anaerolineae bacterium]|jgi:pSer/pThr/pTyr-binding forkhead associated (FHA) protein|nr:winged helix-turn-helix domain-containing protein [Anaerolineae bacterium]